MVAEKTETEGNDPTEDDSLVADILALLRGRGFFACIARWPDGRVCAADAHFPFFDDDVTPGGRHSS